MGMKEYIIKVDEDKKDIMGNCPLVEKPQELVRCKDCKWFSEKGFCKHPNGGAGNIRSENWFCADGERKGETEIIRCKDCKHFVAEGQPCKYHGMYISLKPDNYCTHGERRRSEMNDVGRILAGLKPCPFCGGKAGRRFHTEGVESPFECIITCADCGASLKVIDTTSNLKATQNLAIDKWNTRI